MKFVRNRLGSPPSVPSTICFTLPSCGSMHGPKHAGNSERHVLIVECRLLLEVIADYAAVPPAIFSTMRPAAAKPKAPVTKHAVP